MWWVLALGCGQSSDPGGLDLGENLGEWSDADLSCESAGDCFVGETCVDGSCQVERCEVDLQATVPPMGQGLTFLQENEVAFADSRVLNDHYFVDLYRPEGQDTYDGSFDAGQSRVTDLAGGNFDGTREEVYLVAVDGSSVLSAPTLGLEADTTFLPIAVDAGDVDGDGLDEAVAINAAGALAICHLEVGECEVSELEVTGTARDVAVADVDGDSFEEPVVLLQQAGDAYLYAFSPNAEETGEELSYYGRVDDDYLFRITAGDVDGDLVAEVIGLKDPSWYCLWCDDELHVFDTTAEGGWLRRYYDEVDGRDGLQDIAAGDTDRDDVVEVGTIDGGGGFTLERPGPVSLEQLEARALSVTVAPDRIAMADHDGDAPRANLLEGPERAEGAIVPVMVIGVPPYHRDYSSGLPFAGYGDNEVSGESTSDTVSLNVGASIGGSPSFFGLFGTSISAKVDQSVSNTNTVGSTLSVGNRFTVVADPDNFGPSYGGVVIGWGCFDAYLYEIDDPMGHLGGDGEPFVLTVPTGGGQTLYSTTRYNAMAEALGGLPTIEMPYTIGDSDQLPHQPRADPHR